jgi:hypothetical protein
MALTKVTGAGLGTVDSADLDGAVTINESSADVNFRVESNGLTNALFVDAGNDAVGINTTNASSGRLLHIEGGDTTVGITLKDTAGSQFGINSDGGSLIFKSDTAGAERARIDSSGNVIVGSTTSPTGASNNIVVSGSNWDAVNDTSDTDVTGILIAGNGRMFSQIDGNATGVEVLLVNNIHSSGATCSLIQYRTHNSEEGSLTGNSSGLTINNVSDYRKKERITDLTDSIDVIKTLKPRQYYYRKEFGKPTRAYAGFIAHEVQDSLLPHMTNGLKDGVVTKESKANDEHKDMEIGDPVYQTVAYGDNELITRLVGAVQELSAKVETLEAEVAKLKG